MFAEEYFKTSLWKSSTFRRKTKKIYVLFIFNGLKPIISWGAWLLLMDPFFFMLWKPMQSKNILMERIIVLEICCSCKASIAKRGCLPHLTQMKCFCVLYFGRK